MNRFIIASGLIILVFLVLIWIQGTSLSLAEIPKMINYQGMLTDNATGDPLNGTPDITFRIFDASSGGNKKWEETYSGVTVTKGLFNVILGSVNPIDTLSFTQDYWLEVQVDNDTMPERLQFTSVGYAYRAQVADSAVVAGSSGGVGGWVDDGKVVRLEDDTDSVGIGTDNPSAKLHLVGGALHINTAQVGGYYSHIDGNEISGGVAGGPPGSHHLHIKPGDDSSYLLLAEDGGNVGIGTDDPATKLHLVGGALQINTAQLGGYYSRIDGNEISGGVAGGGPGFHHLHIKPGDNTSYLLLAEDGGNVGIGTTDPSEKLDVNGTARLRGITEAVGDVAAVVVDDNGVLYKSFPSSRRYKENIRRLKVDPEQVLNLQSVRFEWKKTGEEDVGLIAEDVAETVPDLVRYDDEGQPGGVRYNKLAVYLLEVVKSQQERIATLEKEIAELRR